MCILPNYAKQDLKDLERNRKKAAAETVELAIPERPLENSIEPTLHFNSRKEESGKL